MVNSNYASLGFGTLVQCIFASLGVDENGEPYADTVMTCKEGEQLVEVLDPGEPFDEDTGWIMVRNAENVSGYLPLSYLRELDTIN